MAGKPGLVYVGERVPGPGEISDPYAYEERQEREALMRSLHMPMKVWFNNDPDMKEKFGMYPLFWQDLRTWEHYKAVQKLYMIATEERGPSRMAEMSAVVARKDDLDGDFPAFTKKDAMLAEDYDHSAVAGASDGAGCDAIALAENSIDINNGVSEIVGADATSPAAGEGGTDGAPKKKKSRWGGVAEPTVGEGGGVEEGGEKKRKSRWSAETAPAVPDTVLIPGMLPGLALTPEQIEVMHKTAAVRNALQAVNMKLMTVAVDALAREKDPARSPSPEPQYDSYGKRTNTREMRMRASLNKERAALMEAMIALNPSFKPPADYVKAKPHRKLRIPMEEYPTYNFIGLIIGPRGNTQKKLEQETKCKIAIRGRGSIKDGSKGRNTKPAEDENEDLHVYIQGESEEIVEKAAKVIGELLVPMEDGHNEWKQKQLRELALINGTLRDDDFCHVCGEKGHRQFECPNRQKSFKTVEVRCLHCGDTSHPSSDCALRRSGGAGGGVVKDDGLDKEYLNFMEALNGGGGGGGGGAAPKQPAAPLPAVAGGATAVDAGDAAANSGGGGGGGPAPVAWTPGHPSAAPSGPPHAGATPVVLMPGGWPASQRPAYPPGQYGAMPPPPAAHHAAAMMAAQAQHHHQAAAAAQHMAMVQQQQQQQHHAAMQAHMQQQQQQQQQHMAAYGYAGHAAVGGGAAAYGYGGGYAGGYGGGGYAGGYGGGGYAGGYDYGQPGAAGYAQQQQQQQQPPGYGADAAQPPLPPGPPPPPLPPGPPPQHGW